MRHRSLEDALHALPPTEARDRAAAHRLAASVLRRAGSLDAVLEPYLRRAPPDPVRQVLRLGAAQLLLLDTPAHAAVATSVALARARGLAPFTGLVNAVLRRVAEDGAAALAELDRRGSIRPPGCGPAGGRRRAPSPPRTAARRRSTSPCRARRRRAARCCPPGRCATRPARG